MVAAQLCGGHPRVGRCFAGEIISRATTPGERIGTEDYGSFSLGLFLVSFVPTGPPSRGGDVEVYDFNINQLSLPTPVYSVLVSISVFMTLSTVFHSINSPDNSPRSHSVLPVSFSALLVLSTLYIYLYESLLQP